MLIGCVAPAWACRTWLGTAHGGRRRSGSPRDRAGRPGCDYAA